MQPANLPIDELSRLQRWGRAVQKYRKILSVSLIERLAHRGDFLLGTLLRFLPMLTTILLWEAVYLGSGKDELSGYNKQELIAYLLLIHVSRMFSSMPGLATGIARDIRSGTLRKYLVQPLDMIGYLLSYRIAHKLAYIATSFLPYGILFLLCRSYFPGWPDFWTFSCYVLALFMGFLVGFFFEISIGMSGFWLLEITSLMYIVNTLAFFVSGQMFPLEMLESISPHLVTALRFSPWQYLAYFPAAVFIGKIQGTDLLIGLGMQIVWIAFFVGLARLLYRLGLRHYSAFGG